MNSVFINDAVDKKTFLTSTENFIHPILAENNVDFFVSMKKFLMSENSLFLVNGFVGTGKSALVNYCLKFLDSEVITLKYNCFETTILDDILLVLFERFRELAVEEKIRTPKLHSENFVQKISAYFAAVSSPIVLIIDSFEQVLVQNKKDILEFLKHLAQSANLKIILVARKFEYQDFENTFRYDKAQVGALEKHLFEKFLKSSNIKLIGPVSDELYKHTRGYFFYTALSVKVINIRSLSLFEFLNGYAKSFLSFSDFILREALAFVDPVSGHLFRLLTVVRHPLNITLLQTLNLYDEVKVKVFIETMLLEREGNSLYLKDYYKQIAENTIPVNVSVKLHKSCVQLYETQLPLKPMERNLLISRQTIRAEIDYHNIFLPRKIQFKPKVVQEKPVISQIVDVAPQALPSQGNDIKNIRFVFDSQEEEISIMNKIAESINEFITFTDEQLKEIEKENNMSVVELVNRARQEELVFNFNRVVMLYQRCLMMKNDNNYQTLLPVVYTKLAQAYAKLSDWFNSMKYFEEAAKLYVSSGDLIKLSQIKFEIANVYYQMFKCEKAEEILKEIIGMQNLLPETYVRAYILSADLSDNDADKAYECLKNAIEYAEEIEDKNLIAELYYKFAVASDEIGEVKQAVIFYKNCIELEGGNNQFLSSAYSNLASIYEEADAKSSAIKFYEASMAVDERNGNLNGIYLSSMKLGALYKRQNPEMALEFYNRAFDTACKLNEVFYKVSSNIAIGDFYQHSNKSREALEKYELAKSLADGNLGSNNIKKIERRIQDLKLQLGEEFQSKVAGENGN